MQQAPDLELTNSFIGFLDVCNQALESNKETFPYRQMLAASQKVFGDRNIAIRIYEDDDLNCPAGTLTIRLHGDRFEPVTEGERDAAFHLKVKRSYLDRVVQNRKDYIRHPEKLDWEWLKSRFGLDGRESREKNARQVRDVMTRGFETVGVEATVQDAARAMRRLDVGALPVVDGETPVGIVTDRDIAIRSTAEGLDPASTQVRRAMSPGIASCREDTSIDDAASIMEDLKVRRLLVTDLSENPVGMVTLGDLAARSSDRQLAGHVVATVCADAAHATH